MSPNRRGGDRIAGMGNKTSPCKTSVLNLGKTPRVPGLHVVDKQEDATKRLPAKRDAKHSLPTNRRIMSLLSMAVVPEERRAFRRRLTFVVFRSVGGPRLFSVSLSNYDVRATCSPSLGSSRSF